MTYASWYDPNEQKYKISIQIDEGELLELNLSRDEHEQYFGAPGDDGDETPMGTRLRLMAELMDRLDELHTVRYMVEPKRRK